MTTNKKKTYFLAPGFDWPIETGPVQLGNIILGHDTPHQPINSPFEGVPQPYESEQLNWDNVNQKFLNGFVTLYAQFLSTVGIDAELGLKYAKTETECFKFSKLVTREFVPTKAYIEERMKDERVQAEIKKNRIKAYMITGLKLAYYPTMYHLIGGNKGAHAKALVDLTALGVPVKVGPEAGGTSGKVSVTSTKGGTNIVFAYQLTKIDYVIAKGKPVVKTSAFTKGTYLSTEGGKAAKEGDRAEVPEEVRVNGITDGDFKPADVPSKVVVDDVDGDELECVVIDLKSDDWFLEDDGEE